MLDPSQSLNKPCWLLEFFGVFYDDKLFRGCRLMGFICVLYIPMTSCYSWSILRHFGEYEHTVSIMYVLAVIQGLAKLVELKVNHKPMMQLIENFNAENFDIFPKKHNKIISNSLDRANKIFIFFSILLEISMLFVILSWFARKLFDSGNERSLMLDTWLPYAYKESPSYELTVLFQMVSVAFTTNSLLACDSLMFGLIHLMTTQIDILNVELSSLGIKLNISVKKGENCWQILDNIKLCVVYNQHILRNFSVFNSLVQISLVAQLTLTALLVSVSLYTAQQESNNFESIKNMFLIACVIFQLFFYCHFGQTVITKSNNLSKSVYFTKWYEFHCECQGLVQEKRLAHNRIIKKSLLIIMCCVEKPINLTAGKLLVLKYETYVQIIKAGYSYYTVFGG